MVYIIISSVFLFKYIILNSYNIYPINPITTIGQNILKWNAAEKSNWITLRSALVIPHVGQDKPNINFSGQW